jgi:DNA helicase II / ATP-dependent DNA helicase PcrA
VSNRTVLNRALEGLRGNRQQFDAAQEKGHCVVLAGPGSGKTKTLTTAMARCLEEDVLEPRGVACVTYNTECAMELEARLQRLGITSGGRAFVGTVHGFALSQVIAPYARCVPADIPSNFRVATKAEEDAAVEAGYRSAINGPENPHSRWQFATEKRRRHVDRTRPEWHGQNPELAAFIEAYEAEDHSGVAWRLG